MALEKLSDVANALSLIFAKKAARQYNRSVVTAALIPTEAGKGKSVNWNVVMNGAELANGGVASYAEGTDVVSADFAQDAKLPASLPWAGYRTAFAMSERDLDAAMTSEGSSSALIEMFEENYMSSVTALASAINKDIILGDGSDVNSVQTLVGLLGGALDSTGTYANLDRATYPLWQGNVLANGGVARALTTDLMEQALVTAWTKTNLKPTVAVCSPGVITRYKSILEPLRRLNTAVYETGSDDVGYSGIPLIRDKDIPETGGKGTIIFLNQNHIKKVYLPLSQGSRSDGTDIKMMEGYGSNGEDMQPIGLPFRLVPLSKTGDYLKFFVKCDLQLVIDRAAAHSYITDIAV
jgi:hypothetical protein